MAETYEYNGHTISIHMSVDRRGMWKWAYSIDAAGYWESQDRGLSSREIMLAEAKVDAERRVDSLLPSGGV